MLLKSKIISTRIGQNNTLQNDTNFSETFILELKRLAVVMERRPFKTAGIVFIWKK